MNNDFDNAIKNIVGPTSNEDSVEDGKGKKTSFETEMIQIKEDNNDTEIINTERNAKKAAVASRLPIKTQTFQ